ncbi:138.5KD protein [Nilaparvata lugens reovirus]|uniref:138.5KD protein n=1 Tax=Nilaparvata lugens reovirus TaxID=33724 RepID=Q83860_9REOV|nr:major core capsid protein [Nilaparvata lugens reovirus]BAA08544.1 138.5KD protein [Nilaparvata lugens reovirus]
MHKQSSSQNIEKTANLNDHDTTKNDDDKIEERNNELVKEGVSSKIDLMTPDKDAKDSNENTKAVESRNDVDTIKNTIPNDIIKAQDSLYFIADTVKAAQIENEELAKAAANQALLALVKNPSTSRSIVTYNGFPSVNTTNSLSSYYVFIDGSADNFSFPSLFTVSSTFNSEYEIAQNVRISPVLAATMEDAPIIKNSMEAFKQGIVKSVPIWNNTYSASILDPYEFSDNMLAANLVYVGMSNNTYLQSVWLYRMFQCLISGLASENLIFKNIKYGILTPIETNNAMSQSLTEHKIVRNGIPHPTFAGAYSLYTPMVLQMENDLYNNGIMGSAPSFKVSVETVIARLKMDSIAHIVTDQFSSALTMNSFDRLKNRCLTSATHRNLVASCYPDTYTFDFMPDSIYNVTLSYMPTPKETYDSILYILMNNDVKNRFIKVFKDTLRQMNVLTVGNKSLHIMSGITAISSRPDMSATFLSDVTNALTSSNSEIFLDFLAAEFYGSAFVDVRFTSAMANNLFLNSLTITEILVLFIPFPKIAWSSQVTLGSALYRLLQQYAGQELNKWIGMYGLFTHLDEAGNFVRRDLNEADYNNHLLVDERIYYSFLVPCANATGRNQCKIIGDIYDLITPRGARIELINKANANLPYFNRSYDFYVSWRPMKQYQCNVDSPIAQSIQAIINFQKRVMNHAIKIKEITSQKTTLSWISELLAILSVQGAVIGQDYHVCLGRMFSILANTGLSLIDTFDENRPYLQTRSIGFGSYRPYEPGATTNQCISTPMSEMISDTKISYYLLCKQSTVITDDVYVVGAGPEYNQAIYPTIPIFDGKTIYEFIYSVICESRKFVEMLYVFSQVNLAGQDPHFQQIRDAIAGTNTAGTSRKLLAMISDIYKYPLVEMCNILLNGSRVVVADPRLFMVTPYFIDYQRNKVRDQFADKFRTGELMIHVDEWFNKKLDIFSQLFLSTESPVYSMSTGIAFGYFSVTDYNPTRTLDDVCDLERYTLGQEVFLVNTQPLKEVGHAFKYRMTILPGVDTDFSLPSQINIKHILVIPDIKLLTMENAVNFIKEAVELDKIVVEFPNLNYRYQIKNQFSRVNPPYSPSMFENTIADQSSGKHFFEFFDTTSSREFHVMKQTTDYLLLRYINCEILHEQILIRDIYGPNSATTRLDYNFDLDSFGFGLDEGTVYPVTNIPKITGRTVNFNNAIKFVSDNYSTDTPDHNVKPDVIF